MIVNLWAEELLDLTNLWANERPGKTLHGEGTDTQTDRQTDTQTDGHRDLLTESASGPIQ